MSEFKIGDVVNLKSHPKTPMTIQQIGTLITCTWLGPQLDQKVGQYYPTDLIPYISLQNKLYPKSE